MSSKSDELLPKCWICGRKEWQPFKVSSIGAMISAEDFRITDFRYGRTGRIDQCRHCGFKQCVELVPVLPFYQELDDPVYDEGRNQRALQARKILEAVQKLKASGTLLDIGAASGILVECARELGFESMGVEPSRHLAARARLAGLDVRLGVFPHSEAPGPFDVITLVDVIEHVSDPAQLMRDVAAHLTPNGIGIVVTPNVESFAARLLGRRWWHFRVAHIGYFSRSTLLRALDGAGLEPISISSPSWYFRLDYAWERFLRYIPQAMRFKLPSIAERVTIRLNFRDSLQVTFRRKAGL